MKKTILLFACTTLFTLSTICNLEELKQAYFAMLDDNAIYNPAVAHEYLSRRQASLLHGLDEPTQQELIAAARAYIKAETNFTIKAAIGRPSDYGELSVDDARKTSRNPSIHLLLPPFQEARLAFKNRCAPHNINPDSFAYTVRYLVEE